MVVVPRIQIDTDRALVDLGGSLAVASRGLFATGVSTDLNVTYLSSGGKIGDLIKAEVTCDKCASASRSDQYSANAA
jgi:hypothetical protein